MFKNWSIKKRIFATVSGIFLLTVLLMGALSYTIQINHLSGDIRAKVNVTLQIFARLLKAESLGLDKAHAGIDNHPELLRYFAERNLEELRQVAMPIFEQIKTDFGITHMYFIEPDGRIFLRAHSDKRGDTIDRTTFHRAAATQRPSSGVEMGVHFFSLRNVHPVRWQGALIGYFELGQELDSIFSDLKQLTNSDITLLMTQDYARIKNVHLKSTTLFGLNILEATQKQETIRLIKGMGHSPLKQGLLETVVQTVRDGNDSFAVGLTPFKDVADETAGVLMVHWNVRDHVARMQQAIALNVLIVTLVLFSALGLLYMSLRKSMHLFGHLRQMIGEVSETWDLSRRLEIVSRDEIGLLADGFNRFLGKLEQVTQELHSLNQGLEHKIAERTLQLQHKVQTIEDTTRAMTDLAQHHQLILDSVGDGIYGVDLAEHTTFINRAGAAMLGWNVSDLIGKHQHDIMHHTRQDGSPYPVQECPIYMTIRDGQSRMRNEEIFWCRDGSYFPVDYRVTPIHDKSNDVLGSVVVFRDITERVQAQKTNQQLNSLQRVLNTIYRLSFMDTTMQDKLEKALEEIMKISWFFNQSQGGILLLEEDGETLRLTAQHGLDAQLLTQCSRVPPGHCLCGKVAQSKQFLHVAEIDARHDTHFPGMQPHGHYILPLISRKQMLGVLVLYLDHGHPYRSEEEEYLTTISNALASLIERQKEEENLLSANIHLEALVRERTAELQNHITSLKEYQEQLIVSERMAALGGMVAGIAHEINTPVGIGYTSSVYLREQTKQFQELLESDSLTYEAAREYLALADESSQLIESNLRRADELVKSFKMVAVDRSSEQKRSIHLKEYIHDIILSLRPKLKHTTHRIDVQCPSDLILETYPGALALILVNLIMNSLLHGFENKASGTIRITGTVNDREVLLTYEDDGQGMTDETVKRVFEPFFTTKRGQGGSGLGMHVVYNQVTQTLAGTISCSSKPGHGVLFKIAFQSLSKYIVENSALYN
ncbi:MAG: PAS domain S-box protein [Magnetococcales bacterium]|nr:PAS domain S-box protein [Magnetococcales bacterium]